MENLTNDEIEEYLKQRKATAKVKVKKPTIKIKEVIVLDDLVDEILTLSLIHISEPTRPY